MFLKKKKKKLVVLHHIHIALGVGWAWSISHELHVSSTTNRMAWPGCVIVLGVGSGAD
jgi:hypothetical protein